MKGNYNVKGWLNHWLDAKTPTWTGTTPRAYRNLIDRHVVPVIGQVPLSKLTADTLQSLYIELSESDLSIRTIWCIHTMLRGSLESAYAEGLIEANPAAGFDIQLPDDNSRAKIKLKESQVERYLHAAERYGILPIIYIGLRSPVTQTDLFSVAWDAYDMEANTIQIRRKKIKLSARSRMLLDAEHQKHPESLHIFLNPKTSAPFRLHEFYYLHRKLSDEAELPKISFREMKRACREVLI